MEKPMIREPEYNPEFKSELAGVLYRYRQFAYKNPVYSTEKNIVVIVHKNNNDTIKLYNNAYLGDVLIKVCSLDVDGDVYVIDKDSRVYKRISDNDVWTMSIDDTDIILWATIHPAEVLTYSRSTCDSEETVIDYAHAALAKISQLDWTNRNNYMVVYYLDKTGYVIDECATLDMAKDIVESGSDKNAVTMFIDMHSSIIYTLERVDNSAVATELTDIHLNNELEFLSSQTLEDHWE